jgi:flagellum-specific ATP synthase
VMSDIVERDHLDMARKLIRVLATYREAEDLINIGAYVDGSDPNIDFAKKMIRKINSFLQQDIRQNVSFKNSVSRLKDALTE